MAESFKVAAAAAVAVAYLFAGLAVFGTLQGTAAKPAVRLRGVRSI